MANEVATDVTMTNDDYRELEKIADDAGKRERRRQQLLERAPATCRHDTPVDERCFICAPLRLELFPRRDQVPTGNKPTDGSRRR